MFRVNVQPFVHIADDDPVCGSRLPAVVLYVQVGLVIQPVAREKIQYPAIHVPGQLTGIVGRKIVIYDDLATWESLTVVLYGIGQEDLFIPGDQEYSYHSPLFGCY